MNRKITGNYATGNTTTTKFKIWKENLELIDINHAKYFIQEIKNFWILNFIF